MAEKKEQKLTFEAGLERLEQIVKQLEQGDLALEESLELFEEGMKLSGLCRQQLEEAECKVELLVKKGDGKMTAEPFSPGSSPAGTSSKDEA